MTTPDKNISQNPHNAPHMTLAYLAAIPTLTGFYNDMINTHAKNRNLVNALKASLAYHLEKDTNALIHFTVLNGEDPYTKHGTQAATHIADETKKFKADYTPHEPIKATYRYNHSDVVHRACRVTGDAVRLNTLMDTAQNHDDPYWQQVNACATREAHQTFMDEYHSWKQESNYPQLLIRESESPKDIRQAALREVIDLFREINRHAATTEKAIATQRRQRLPVQYSSFATPPDDDSQEKVKIIIDSLINDNTPMVSAVLKVYNPEDPTQQFNYEFIIVVYEHEGMIHCQTPQELYPPALANQEIQDHHDNMMIFYHELRNTTTNLQSHAELFRQACEDMRTNLHGRRDVTRAGIIR